jgi:hypothetical protein
MFDVPEPRAGKSEGSRLVDCGWPHGVDVRSNESELEVYGFVEDGRDDSVTVSYEKRENVRLPC